MSTFSTIQPKLAAARERFREAQKTDANLRQQLDFLEAAITHELRRTGQTELSEQDGLSVRKKELLQKQQNEEDGVFKELHDAREAVAHEMGQFNALGSPEELIRNLDDALPVLLFPLRLQTRFVKTKYIARDIPLSLIEDAGEWPRLSGRPSFQMANLLPENGGLFQLPTFELIQQQLAEHDFGDREAEKLIEKRIRNGHQFIQRQKDKYELWVRIYPDDILIQTHEEALTPGEVLSGQSFWQEVWQPGKKEKELSEEEKLAPWRSLQSSYRVPRALWISSQTKPDNYPGEDDAFPEQPVFPQSADPLENPDLKTDSWTQAPYSWLLPDRFTVRLFSKDVQGTPEDESAVPKDVHGNPVQWPLALGFNPAEENSDALTGRGETLNMPADIRWITDFEEAEKVGMAIRIELTELEWEAGFEQLVVLGVRSSSDSAESQQLVEELFINHQYKAGGMSFLPQGTPTNNTKKKKTLFQESADDFAFHLPLAMGQEQFGMTFNPYYKKDGQWLTEALGVDPAIFQQVAWSGHTDIRESLAMNQMLYPATFGYYLEQFLFPLLSDINKDVLYDFFSHYVSARGLLPALRVGKQPYGFLAASAFSHWEYPPRDLSNNFLQRLHKNVLKNLLEHWKKLSQSVNQVGELENADNFAEKFMDIVGLHATSGQLMQRYVVGNSLVEMVRAWNHQAAGNTLTAVQLQQRLANELKVAANDSTLLLFPPVANQLFFQKENRLLPYPLIDALPLSETRPLQNLWDIGENYLEWLENASLADIRYQQFDSLYDVTALDMQNTLYNLTRQSLMRSWLKTGIELLEQKGRVSPVTHIDFELDDLKVSGDNLSQEALTEQLLHYEHRFYLLRYLQQQEQARVRAEGLARANEVFSDAVSVDDYDRFLEDYFEERDEGADKTRREMVYIKAEAALNELLASNSYELKLDKWEYLETDYEGHPLREYIEEALTGAFPEEGDLRLRRLRNALRMIKDLPTARLERLLAEHLDICSFRLDAWLQALVYARLEEQRRAPNGENGLFIGAYGFLEKVQRKPGSEGIQVEEVGLFSVLSAEAASQQPAEVVLPLLDFSVAREAGYVPEELLGQVFLCLNDEPGLHYWFDADKKEIRPDFSRRINPDSEGFIPAPSVTHATAAAVLRGGYRANQLANAAEAGASMPPDGGQAFAVNLNSTRVRQALLLLEGVGTGQELPALLGYQFERLLSENNLHQYIYDIRQRFPYRNEKEEDLETTSDFYVTDGLKVIRQLRLRPAIFPGVPSVEDSNKVMQIGAKLEDSLDALNDLLISEGVFQMVQGRPEKAKEAMDALNEGGLAGEPQMIKTPHSGASFSLKLGIVFDSVTDEENGWTASESPRSWSSPALNNWLKAQLPHPENITLNAKLPDETAAKFTLVSLDLQPVDLVYWLAEQPLDSQIGALIAWLREQIRKTVGLPLDATIELHLLSRAGFQEEELSLGELKPLCRQLIEMIENSRALEPGDFTASPEEKRSVSQVFFSTSNQDVYRLWLAGRNVEGPGEYLIWYALSLLIDAGETWRNAWKASASLEELQDKYSLVFDGLMAALRFGVPEALPVCGPSYEPELGAAISKQLLQVRKILVDRKNEAAAIINAKGGQMLTPSEFAETLQEAAEKLFGRTFRVFPAFHLFNPEEVSAAWAQDYQLEQAGPFALEEWLQGVSLVREDTQQYHQFSLLREAATGKAPPALQPLQFPFMPEGCPGWFGLPLPEGGKIRQGAVSLAFEISDHFQPTAEMAGLLIDEWLETIPDATLDAGLALHYNQPNAEAPQVILLAVSPKLEGHWTLDKLMDTVRETMELAKTRAVDAKIIQQESVAAHYLPMILAPIDSNGHTATTDFGQYL